MTALDPKLDKIGVFSSALGALAEMTPAVLLSKALVNGAGISLTPNPATGQLTISATGTLSANVKVPYVLATGSAAVIVATYAPALTTLGAGDLVSVLLAYNIIGATTATINAVGTYPLVQANGAAMVNGYALAGTTLLCEFDGTSLRVLAPSTAVVAPTPAPATYPAIGSRYAWTGMAYGLMPAGSVCPSYLGQPAGTWVSEGSYSTTQVNGAGWDTYYRYFAVRVA
jgi:hypothetical protein